MPCADAGFAGSKKQDPAYERDRRVGRVLFFRPAICRPAVCALLLAVTVHAAPGRRVTFRAEDGAPLTGAYYEPSQRPAPGIVLLHMWRRSHADWDRTASQLSDAGFAVLALDYRNNVELGA